MVHKTVSVAIQAGLFDVRNIATIAENMLEKCTEIQSFFKHTEFELRQGRKLMEAEERKLDKMQKSVGVFEEQVDALGIKLLKCNTDVAQKNALIDKLKRDIALKKESMAKEHLPQFEAQYQRQERLQELKTERQELELLLHKVNLDIEQTYEEVFEAEEKLNGLKELRAFRRDEETRYIDSLKEKTDNIAAKKQDLLGISDRGRVDMSKIYVSPEDFHHMEVEIDKLKQEQALTSLHIKMQVKERDYLREVSQDIFQRLYNLEKKALECNRGKGGLAKAAEPNLYQDLSGPSIWYTSPPLTVMQLKKLQEDHHWKYSNVGENTEHDADGTSVDIEENESPGACKASP